MGSAASGTALAASRRFPPLTALAAGFAASVVTAYLVLNYLPFDSFSLAWDERQLVLLILYFFAAGIPFLFAGWAAGACLMAAGADAHRPYAANLAGAALGSLAAIVALEGIAPEGLVFLAAALALGAGLAFYGKGRYAPLIALASITAMVIAARPPAFLQLHLSPYRPLASARLAPAARQNASTSSRTPAFTPTLASVSMRRPPSLSRPRCSSTGTDHGPSRP
jgi:hypothetical protein